MSKIEELEKKIEMELENKYHNLILEKVRKDHEKYYQDQKQKEIEEQKDVIIKNNKKIIELQEKTILKLGE